MAQHQIRVGGQGTGCLALFGVTAPDIETHGSEQTHRLKTNSQTQDIQTHTGALADLGFRTQSKFELFKLI